MKSVDAAYAATCKFNEIAGNLSVVTEESIASQLDFIQEEYLETCEAFDKKDTVALLDGLCDILVTTFGLAQKLSVAGYDVDEAMRRVCENNLSKYPPKGQPLRYHHDLTATLNEKHKVYVLKNAVGKIMKPYSFTPVILDDLVPDKWWGGQG